MTVIFRRSGAKIAETGVREYAELNADRTRLEQEMWESKERFETEQRVAQEAREGIQAALDLVRKQQGKDDTLDDDKPYDAVKQLVAYIENHACPEYR